MFVTKQQLATSYGVSRNTFSRWLQQADLAEKLQKNGYKPTQRILEPLLLVVIYGHLDFP